jgi:hypothetical protein
MAWQSGAAHLIQLPWRDATWRDRASSDLCAPRGSIDRFSSRSDLASDGQARGGERSDSLADCIGSPPEGPRQG